MMTRTAPQDDAARPGDTPEPPSTTVAPSPSAAQPGLSPRPFTPRWGRIAVALVGLLALCAALVTLVLGAVGIVSFFVPLACVGLAAAAVAVLRLLAVRSREARVNRAFADAMAPVREPAPERTGVAPPVPSAPKRPTALFDAEEAAERPLTAMERRTAALAGSSVLNLHDQTAPAEASEGSETSGGTEASEGTDAAQPTGATAWAPVEVPRPTYVDAAKAERQAPAPLDLPEAPKPSTRTPIKASEAAARVAAAADTAAASADSTDASSGSDPATGRINLDDVLQRRRA
ncbi:hypothetical protein ACX80J_00730 [Arthrobacter sp. MDB2-24]